jgi:hypothetical protein
MNDANEIILTTSPLSDGEKKLREKFYESFAGQSDVMDKLAGQLLTLELGIPGLYAAAVKMFGGDKATVQVDVSLVLTFLCWIGALGLTLWALFPQKWKVDTSIINQDPDKMAEGIGIEDFFTLSADSKRKRIAWSSVLFFAGIFFAVFTVRG